MKNLLYILIIIMATCLVAGVALLVIPTDSGDTTTDEPVTDVTDCSVAGHDYESLVTVPTCTETGYTTYTCTVCGDSYIAEETDATGHDYIDNVCAYCGEVSYWLTFTGDSDFTTIALSNVETVGVNVEISDNTSFWYTWDGSEYEVTDSTVYVRGYDNSSFSTSCIEWGFPSNFSTSHCWFVGSFSSCTGNIMSLLDYSDPDNAVMGDYAFSYMFRNCTYLVTAPSLPSMTLSKYCYCAMFYGCSLLASAPELPAITLAYCCYGTMFYGCKALKSSPELPATTLASYCYSYMFYRCTYLTTVSELPATTLAVCCYKYMFYNCYYLRTVPELPATKLASSCYYAMFSSCGITTAPSLPAKTLVDGCYSYMFSHCSSLTIIPSLSHVINLYAGACTCMFRSCSKLCVSTDSSYGTLLVTIGSYSYTDMFTNTGGEFTGSPEASTSYYTSNETV